MGATGTGKTLFAERAASALTELTDTEWRLLRYDMSEFSERHAVSRLLGAPPGYVGHGSGSSLATELAAHPNCVIMFDEIDKAHPEVLIALMNLMDKGRLGNTDGAQPAAVSSILLFTSNLAINTNGNSRPMSVSELEHAARQALLAHGTRPEIVARFANICTFTPLTGRERAFVAARSVKRVAEDYGVAVTSIDPAYLSGLLERTHDSRIGVRGLEYLVDADLGEQLAKRALGDNVEVIGSDPQVRTTPPSPASQGGAPSGPGLAGLSPAPHQET
jgi:ATP-dependent Clp protease ATP-binding subunit ClpB